MVGDGALGCVICPACYLAFHFYFNLPRVINQGYTVEAFQHRQEIIKTNGELNTYHVGAYLGDGLHEGAITSAIRVAEAIVNTVETQSLFLSPIPY